MLRQDGFVKLLDFGLAKLIGPPAESAETDAAPAPQTSTERGMVLGTVSYMSPEQARGLNVDAVIEGSVRRDGGQVKITARLIQVVNETPLRSSITNANRRLSSCGKRLI